MNNLMVDLTQFDNSPFLHSTGELSFWSNANRRIIQIDYVQSYFKEQLFQEFDIHYPTSLQRAVVKRKSEYLAGRLCAQQALKSIGILPIDILADDNRCPIFPEGIQGSITHTSKTAIAVVSKTPGLKGIGIDLEQLVKEELMHEIASQIIFGEESDLLKSDKSEPRCTFSLIFSLKESFFKAAYHQVGQFFNFDAVRLAEIDFDAELARIEVMQNLCEGLEKGMLVSGRFKIFDNRVLSMVEIG